MKWLCNKKNYIILVLFTKNWYDIFILIKVDENYVFFIITHYYLFICLFVCFRPKSKGNCLFYQQFRFWKKFRFFFFHNSMITSLNSELFSYCGVYISQLYFFWIIFWDCWVYILQLLFFPNYFLRLMSLHFTIIIFHYFLICSFIRIIIFSYEGIKNIFWE